MSQNGDKTLNKLWLLCCILVHCIILDEYRHLIDTNIFKWSLDSTTENQLDFICGVISLQLIFCSIFFPPDSLFFIFSLSGSLLLYVSLYLTVVFSTFLCFTSVTALCPLLPSFLISFSHPFVRLISVINLSWNF